MSKMGSHTDFGKSYDGCVKKIGLLSFKKNDETESPKEPVSWV